MSYKLRQRLDEVLYFKSTIKHTLKKYFEAFDQTIIAFKSVLTFY